MYEHFYRRKLRNVQSMRRKYLSTKVSQADPRSFEIFDALERHAFYFALQEAELAEWGKVQVSDKNASTGQIWANMALRRMMSDFLASRQKRFSFRFLLP
jgi:hypothetical protein